MSLDVEWDIPHLHSLISRFTMLPDVKSQLEREFRKGTDFYRVIMYNVSADMRLLDSIVWALTHKGNIVVAVYGRQRHGKSTFSRFLCVLIHLLRQTVSKQKPSMQGWETKVVYDRSYSDMTNRIKLMVEEWVAEGHSEEEIVNSLIKDYVFNYDEVNIEHEEGSGKARDDQKNLVETNAMAGIHFIYTCPSKRSIGEYFSVWVVGYDTKTSENLCFYYDTDGICQGMMITPRIKETQKYDTEKIKFIFGNLRYGGRKKATQKELEDEQEIPIAPDDLEPGDEFSAYAVERAKREYSDPDYHRVLELIVQGLPQDKVAEKVFTSGDFQMKVSRIMQDIGLHRLGYWFEDWWCLKHGITPNNLKNKPIPDAIVDGVPHSLKCYYNNRRTITLKRDALFPEIEYAQTHNTGIVLVFHNLWRNSTITRAFTSADSIPDTITITFPKK